MIAIICILFAVAIIATIKALIYFYALCGILHYLLEKYNDDIKPEEVRRLTIKAFRNIQW